ncbi:MAG: response regulator [Candidatus Methanofastidiosa archaeon]|nr:response regulator [Candidatus Methanofastidiosa archaeon]
MSDTKILIVEDEVELLEVYSEILGNDYVVFKAENGKDAIEIFDKENPDIAILDIKLPDISGIELTKYIKDKSPNTIVVGVSAYGEKLKDALNVGATTVVQKPFMAREIHTIIDDLSHIHEYSGNAKTNVDAKESKIPSSLTRVAFEAVKENMGEGSLKLLLKRSGLERYIGNMPPYDDSPSITLDEYIKIIHNVFDIFGEKGAKPILYICGKAGFKHSLEEKPALFGIAGVAMKVMSDEKKKKFILPKVLKKLEEIFGNPHILEEDEKNLYVRLPDCQYCRGLKSTNPICFTPIGFYEEVIKWATGKSEKVEQIQCRAMGHESCVFKIPK